MYSHRVRIFGPKYNHRYFRGPPIQRGSGLASFFGRIAKKIIPFASRGLKKVVKSDFAKDIGEVLLTQGANTATSVLSNLIEGKENPLEEAETRLKEARKDLANVIRKRKFVKTDKTDNYKPPPAKKKHKQKVKVKAKVGKKYKKYNLFRELEDV